MSAIEKIPYEIRVQGTLDARWAGLFAPLDLRAQKDETLIAGAVQDQAELFGILLKIRDIGLKLVSVRQASLRSCCFPVLTTDRLLLREFCLEDAPAVFDIFRREDVNEWLETPIMQSIEDAEARVRGRIGLFNDGMGFRWAIALRENPAQLIGSCGFFSLRRGTQTVEAGYELHPDFWRRGIMTEALRAVIQFSFGEQQLMPVHRIEALVSPGNIASLRLLEKLGFVQECLRREFFFWNNRYQDVYLCALLNS